MKHSDMEKSIENSVLCSEELNDLAVSLEDTADGFNDVAKEEQDIKIALDTMKDQLEQIAEALQVPISIPPKGDFKIAEFNAEIDVSVVEWFPEVKAFPPLETTDYVVAAIAGILSVTIDVVFVGTPEVVKLYKGGENFDGSKLTGLIRKISPEDGTPLGESLKWLSDKCKVPYDISVKSGVVTPNNHRLRSLGHDPFLGLFFAVADIIMGTATVIDNEGKLRILQNYQVAPEEKILSVFYYIGHIVSDLFTARGIPVPGFFLTQFFTGEVNELGDSIATIAEDMYKDGYDMRHLASMAVPVIVKNLIVEAYWRMTKAKPDPFSSLAEQERTERDNLLKKAKMLFIADSVGAGGNLVKFLAPPVQCDPRKLNVAQWFAFIRSSIAMCKAECRDKSVDIICDGRKAINEKWEEFLGLANRTKTMI